MEMKKIEKMSSIFEFSISKLGHKEIFMKTCGKISSIFEFSISKLGYMEFFIKIW